MTAGSPLGGDSRDPGPGGRALLRAMAGILATVLATIVGARIAIPMAPVPVTLQTFALFVGAALIGARSAAWAAGLYLALAFVGLPVLADGEAVPNWALFEKASAGYLIGFVPAAALVGWMAGRGDRIVDGRAAGASRLVRGMLVGHFLVLMAGMLWLLRTLDLPTAFRVGVRPFVLGAALKSLAGAWVVRAVLQVRGGGESATSGDAR